MSVLEHPFARSAYIGTSIAISWAWGTSLILGMQIAQQKGLESFLIWATANCLTLGIFGILYKIGFLKEAVLNQKIIKPFTNLIQIFCLIIQLKILCETFQNFFDLTTSYCITTAIGIGLEIWMWKKGLWASIFTDLFQGIGTLLVLITMVWYALTSDMLPSSAGHSSSSDILWGLWSACILLSGIMTDLQHWQRAKVNGKMYSFEFATFFFALYLSLVFVLSKYQFDSFLNLMLLFAVIGVTTSTIDSIAVALHKDFGRNLGTLLGIAICIAYGLLVKLSVLEIWSWFGIIRVGLALYIIGWCFKNKYVKNQEYSQLYH